MNAVHMAIHSVEFPLSTINLPSYESISILLLVFIRGLFQKFDAFKTSKFVIKILWGQASFLK